MPGDGARRGDRTPEPLVADQVKRADETDTGGLDAGLLGHALHLQTDEVIGEQDPPELLPHGLRALAPDRLLTLEHFGLDLVVPELDLPRRLRR